jgi:hypothetical protein
MVEIRKSPYELPSLQDSGIATLHFLPLCLPECRKRPIHLAPKVLFDFLHSLFRGAGLNAPNRLGVAKGEIHGFNLVQFSFPRAEHGTPLLDGL